MVCLGNICRSPMAEGVLRSLAAREGLDVITDSAGTSGFHVGEAPDPRARAVMRSAGMGIDDLRARRFERADLERFDRVFAMDAQNLIDIRGHTTDAVLLERTGLLLDLVPTHPLREVPDPYYGDEEDFNEVLRMLEEACTALLSSLRHGG